MKNYEYRKESFACYVFCSHSFLALLERYLYLEK